MRQRELVLIEAAKILLLERKLLRPLHILQYLNQHETLIRNPNTITSTNQKRKEGISHATCSTGDTPWRGRAEATNDRTPPPLPEAMRTTCSRKDTPRPRKRRRRGDRAPPPELEGAAAEAEEEERRRTGRVLFRLRRSGGVEVVAMD